MVQRSHQFLQAFFFLAAPSPQLGALRDAGSGFFKSSSSRRASESMRSWTRQIHGIQYSVSMLCSAWWSIFVVEIKAFQCSRDKSVPPSQIVWCVFKSFFTRRQTDWMLTYHIIIVHVIGRQRPHFDSVGIQSWFLCWNQNVCKMLFELKMRWNKMLMLLLADDEGAKSKMSFI